MNVIITTGFEKILSQIEFQPQTINKGRKLVLAEHVRNVQEHRANCVSYLITAQVIRQASVMSTPYKTSLRINVARVIISVSCDCVYNQSGKCKHVAAVIYFINNSGSESKTSVEQKWGAPSPQQFAKEKYCKGKNFEDMFPPKPKKKCQQKFDPSELIMDSPLKLIMIKELEDSDVNDVKSIIDSMINNIELKFENEETIECLNNFFLFNEEHAIYSNSYHLEKNVEQFYKMNIVLSQGDIINLCCKTSKQSSSKEWHAARRLRLSASTNIHNIKVRKTKSIESLVSDFLYPKQINCASTKYGLNNEGEARKKYQQLHNFHVKQVGVMVSQYQPWLCASIDGIVIEDGCIIKIVELKCPISCSNKPVINYADKVCNVPYLRFEDNMVVLIKSKAYYTQIQVQMYVTGMTVCDLFVYSPVEDGCCTVQVHRDDDFLKEVIPRCEEFYFKQYLPALQLVTNKNNNKNVQGSRNFTGKDVSNNMQ